MMKRIMRFSVLLTLIVSGCVADTRNLTEEQQQEAIKKYPRSGLNLQPDDGAGMITAKVLTRVLLWPITLGISEGALLVERNESFSKYEADLEKKFYDSFIGRNRVAVINEFGAPSRSCSDGADGEIYIYEREYTTGGEGWSDGRGNYYSTPYRFHKDVKEFYFNAQGICYRWRLKTE